MEAPSLENDQKTALDLSWPAPQYFSTAGLNIQPGHATSSVSFHANTLSRIRFSKTVRYLRYCSINRFMHHDSLHRYDVLAEQKRLVVKLITSCRARTAEKMQPKGGRSRQSPFDDDLLLITERIRCDYHNCAIS